MVAGVVIVLLLALCAGLGLARSAAAAPERHPVRAGAAEQPEDRRCDSAGLDKARAGASVRLRHGGRVHTKATARLTVHVPRSWRHAESLLMGHDSGEYRKAMACLTRPYAVQFSWGSEWRPGGSPRVEAEKGGFKVVFDTFAWIEDATGWIAFGPWWIELGTARWRIHFDPAPALRRVNWTKILVDPGAPGAESAEPKPTTREGDTALVWRPKGEKSPPRVAVRLAPDWRRSFAAQDDRLVFANVSNAGGASWTVLVSGLMLYAARRIRRRGAVTAAETAAARTLSDWAWVSFGLIVVVLGDEVLYRTARTLGDTELWYDREQRLSLPFTIGLGALALAFGRPRRTIVWTAAALAAPALVVSCAPRWFDLPPSMELLHPAPDRAVYALFAAQGSVLAFGLLGLTAAAWRAAGECGLLPPGRTAPHGPRGLRARYALPAVLAGTAFVGTCYTLTVERDWRRISWLSRRGDPQYGISHLEDVRGDLTWFSANFQNWWFGLSWLVTGLVVLAALRAAVPRGTESPVAEAADRRLFLLFFSVMVGLGVGVYANNALLEGVGLLLNMAALRLVTAVGTSRTVLEHPLRSTGERLGDTVTAARRPDLLGRARRYREIHAQMRRLDAGQSDDDILQRRLLEQEVRGLHTWTGRAGGPDRLPSRVSVVDVALAMGPRDTWWGNGRRGALIACFFGLPASTVLVWSGWIRGDNWRWTAYYGFGLPDLVCGFVVWQVTWAGAGFVLGALWRRLPGRRGPVKALAVTAAFALPVGADALGNWFMDLGYGDSGLVVVTMLLVLTLTGIALDLDIFQGERRFWQSRFGLLLSIYQMRYFSLQLAYLVAQAVAAVTLWQFFADTGGGPPPKEFEGGGGGGGR